MSRSFAKGFLWGAATAAHQVEGNNLNNDFWQLEHAAAEHGVQFSGDAVDSYHRYPEDMRLLADAGLNAYRFSLEWSRIEPSPGKFSRAQLAPLPPHDRYSYPAGHHAGGDAAPLHPSALVRRKRRVAR
ncbi:family 1 glycosylhydrolase [Nonomuraea sp. NPDC049129]|uniref:family 1 glycosylhydrolase n=1 Tax=Nonomuraea sp. NPDC049129 TaxID=3155272 RepID=UPI0033EEBF7B